MKLYLILPFLALASLSGKLPMLNQNDLIKQNENMNSTPDKNATGNFSTCLIEIETDSGTMVIRLSDATPLHRDNFIKIAEEGYYDGTLFHRVIRGFMIQGGDPNSRNAGLNSRLGSGGPDYTISAEFVDTLYHVKGAIAAARQGDQVNPEKRSSGSQFYIVQGKTYSEQELTAIEARKKFRYTKEQREAYSTVGGTPFLDGDYTVFGYMVKGLEVIDKLAAVETLPGDRPRNDVKMKVRVIKQ